MEMLQSPDFWLGLLKIIWINIILSGDNAVVIALACRNLPPQQRKLGILYGTAGAIIQFYVRATAANGQIAEMPKAGAAAPGISTPPMTKSTCGRCAAMFSRFDTSVSKRGPKSLSICVKRGSEMSMMDLFHAGKEIMWPILLLSFVGITVWGTLFGGLAIAL